MKPSGLAGELVVAIFGPVIVNAVFTGDRERHEAEIRSVWGGPLCVVEREVPTADELARIRKEAEAGLHGLASRCFGPRVTASSPSSRSASPSTSRGTDRRPSMPVTGPVSCA